MMQTLTLKGICIQYPFSRLMLGIAERTKDIEVRGFPMAPSKGSHQFCHPNEEMFLIETPPQGPADVEGVTLPPAPKRAQVIGTVVFDACWEYKSVAAFRKDAKRHRILPTSKHDWDGKSKRYAWEVSQTTQFLTPVPAAGHNLYGFQTPKAVEVQYARFSDVLRHTEGVDEPVSPLAVSRMIYSRLEALLPSWPGLSDVPTPSPGDAGEAPAAELYILWLLGTFASRGALLGQSWQNRQDHEQLVDWSRTESHSSHGGSAAAEALRQRLLAEYWACSVGARQEYLRETSALLAANRNSDLTCFLDEQANRARQEEQDWSDLYIASFHQLRVAPEDPRLQKFNLCLVTQGSAHHRMCLKDESGDTLDEPDKTNEELLGLLAEHENTPAIYRYLSPGGFAFVTQDWLRSDKWWGP